MVQIFYDNPILDSRRLIFEQLEKSGFHIRKGLLLKFEYIQRHNFVQSAVLPIGGMAQGYGKTQYPHKWEIPNKPGKVAVWGFWRFWRGVGEMPPLCPGSGQVMPTSGHVTTSGNSIMKRYSVRLRIALQKELFIRLFLVFWYFGEKFYLLL